MYRQPGGLVGTRVTQTPICRHVWKKKGTFCTSHLIRTRYRRHLRVVLYMAESWETPIISIYHFCYNKEVELRKMVMPVRIFRCYLSPHITHEAQYSTKGI